MTKVELFQMMNENMAFHLATSEDGQPHVRGMLLFRADEDGIIFHTGEFKDLYRQQTNNAKVELCFNSPTLQVRVTGEVEQLHDKKLVEEIYAHPTRQFMRNWKEQGIDAKLAVFCVKNGVATTWSMATNFERKEYINL